MRKDDRMPTDEPRVSVVVPTHNRAALLREAIESVCNQTVDCWELIIVDDGSTDGTARVVEPYLADPRVRFRRRPNGGRAAARNDGVSLAEGELICFLDSDDRYLAGNLESHLGVLDASAGVGMSIGGYEFIDEGGASLGSAYLPWHVGGALDLEGWLLNGFAMPGSIMIRREWFERVGGFDPAMTGGEDRDLFLRLAQAGCPMSWVREIVSQNRRHAGNTDLREHQSGLLHALAKIFDDPSLPPALGALEARAHATIYIRFATVAAAAGDDALVRDDLRKLAALSVDLRRTRAHREMCGYLELLQQHDTQAAEDLRAALRVDPRWRAHRTIRTFRRAYARWMRR
jgi:glycosyltransferase involved in cell wall biosynthesis